MVCYKLQWSFFNRTMQFYRDSWIGGRMAPITIYNGAGNEERASSDVSIVKADG